MICDICGQEMEERVIEGATYSNGLGVPECSWWVCECGYETEPE